MASIYKRYGKGNRRANYYVSWIDHEGNRRTKCAGTSDKSTALRIAAKLEAEAALRRSGVVDPLAEEFSTHSQRPLREHLQA